MRTLVTIFCFIASASFGTASRAGGRDVGILRAVLVDAHARLRTSPVPCVDAGLKSADTRPPLA